MYHLDQGRMVIALKMKFCGFILINHFGKHMLAQRNACLRAGLMTIFCLYVGLPFVRQMPYDPTFSLSLF